MQDELMTVRPAGLLLREGRLLTMRYQYAGHDRYNLPGGKPEDLESLEQTLIREFMEELTLSITTNQLCFIVETHAAQRNLLHLLFSVTENHLQKPSLNPVQTKAMEICWLTPSQVAEYPLYPAVGPLLSAWMQGHPTQAVYQGVVTQDWY